MDVGDVAVDALGAGAFEEGVDLCEGEVGEVEVDDGVFAACEDGAVGFVGDAGVVGDGGDGDGGGGGCGDAEPCAAG